MEWRERRLAPASTGAAPAGRSASAFPLPLALSGPRVPLSRLFPSPPPPASPSRARAPPLSPGLRSDMAADLCAERLRSLPASWSYGISRGGRIFFIK